MFLSNFFRSLIFGVSLGEILFLSSVTPVMANPKYNQDNIIQLMASSQEPAPDIDEKSRLDQSLEPTFRTSLCKMIKDAPAIASCWKKR